ncbi:MAG: hypothetical protein NVSMB27_31730 [Ktedonobacteraceae bacterium]
MKQGNGSDLLGANDPRASTIGIIYVASNDEKDSVLTAILTQEKLGRKQIALVLPNQNKAFQRPVDFDGLKNMRRKLQAQLIIVAPQGSGPADFARQRRFPFFSSIVNYKESLQEETEASRASRRGGWLGLGNQKQSATDNDVEDLTPLPSNMDANMDDFGGREPHEPHAADPNINAAALGLGMGAAGYEAGHLMGAHYDEDDETPMRASAHYGNEEDEDVRLSPGGSPQQGSYRDEDDMGAPPPLIPGTVEDAEDIDTHPLSPLSGNAGNPPVPPIEPDDDEYDDEGPPSPLPLRRGSTGPRPAVVPSAPVIVPRSGTTGGNYAGGTPPPVIVPGGGGNAGHPPRQRRSGWQLLLIALIALLLFSLLLCGGIALAAPGALGAVGNAMSHIVRVAPPSATVTITPKTPDLSNSYVLTGLTTGVPDANKRQVQARQLTFTSQPPASKTVNATGTHPAQQATGTLTFSNGLGIPQTVRAVDAVFQVGSVQIKVNNNIVIPAASPGGRGVVTVAAFATPAGGAGNIGAFAINQFCCSNNSSISVQNQSAFMNGRDPYTVVQQSDIDNAANPLAAQIRPGALSSFNALKHANEQFVSTPQCTSNVTPDHNAGDRATSVTVKVTVTCSGVVYDQSGPGGVQAVAETILKGEASADITKNDPTANPADYALQENTFVAKVTQATIDKNKNVILQVNADGIWVYQYTPAKLAQLKTLIAGKSSDTAKTLLAGQPGVSLVDSIVLSDNSSTLPTDVKLINIVVKTIPGVQGTPTVTPGTPGAGTPTPVGTLTSPIATPTAAPGK